MRSGSLGAAGVDAEERVHRTAPDDGRREEVAPADERQGSQGAVAVPVAEAEEGEGRHDSQRAGRPADVRLHARSFGALSGQFGPCA